MGGRARVAAFYPTPRLCLEAYIKATMNLKINPCRALALGVYDLLNSGWRLLAMYNTLWPYSVSDPYLFCVQADPDPVRIGMLIRIQAEEHANGTFID